jgi:hypothetical protein
LPHPEDLTIRGRGDSDEKLRYDVKASDRTLNPVNSEDMIDSQLDHLRSVKSELATFASGVAGQKNDGRYMSDERLRMGLDGSLDRFKALTLNGMTLTEATIGGYRLDIASLSKKAAAVLPLPPIALPLIFLDTDLNFSHHFFQGLEIIAGRQFIVNLAEVRKYHGDDEIIFGPLIKDLVQSGYMEGDADLVVFVKRVISTTFEILREDSRPGESDVFLVASNFYGFNYIESGMQCREQDLKMWLQSAYSQYRNLWFNAFKSSGVPDFALDGVQDRYATASKSENSALRRRQAVIEWPAEEPTEKHRSSGRRSRSSKEERSSTRRGQEAKSRGFFG